MGNLEKILVGIIIVTIVAILGLAIWGLGSHDTSRLPAEDAAVTSSPETDPIPSPGTSPPMVAEIPSNAPPAAGNEITSLANDIGKLVSGATPEMTASSTAPLSGPPLPESAAGASQPKFDPYPTLAERSRKYVVKKGDSYEKIARSELGDSKKWRLIQEMNKDVPPSKLYPGSLILLPSEEEAAMLKALPFAPASASSSPSTAKAPAEKLVASVGDPEYYTVKKGDTLYSLAKEYLRDGNKWRLIADANPGKIRGASQITAGTRLRIPRN